MAHTRLPGPIGVVPGVGELPNQPCSIANQANSNKPGPVKEPELTAEQQELALDIAQITLDIVGIFEPTPFADGTNALISIGRGDWFGAALSGISIIPYIGDLAKAGKLPRYAQKLHDAIQLAKKDAAFAKALRPALEQLKKVLDSIPDNLSTDLTEMVNKIKKPIDEFLGKAKLAKAIPLKDRLILARMGSLKNIGEIVEKNIETAVEFFVRNNIPENKMIDALNGIDVHKPVEILQLKKGDKISTTVVLPPKTTPDDFTDAQLREYLGEWFVVTGGGVGKESVGIAHGARQTVHFEVVQPASVLKSKAASVDDSWTDGMHRKLGHDPLPAGRGTKKKPWTELEYDPTTKKIKVSPAKDKKTGKPYRSADGELKTSLGVGTQGGGTQLYFPRGAQKSSGGLKAVRILKYGPDNQNQMTIESGDKTLKFDLDPSDNTIQPSGKKSSSTKKTSQ